MKVKLTLHRGESRTDLVLTTDASATVGEIAERLIAADPRSPGQREEHVSLRILDTASAHGARQIPPITSVGESGLLSGAHVEVIRVSPESYTSPELARGAGVARLRVLAGPDAGKEFSLPRGAAIIGRDRDISVRLSDPMVSKRHARINIADGVEIIDLGSANGTEVSGEVVDRASLASTDTVTIGDTTMAVVLLQQSTQEHSAVQIEHVRSPRVIPRFRPEEVEAPSAPKSPQAQRFPYLALLAPLAMGAVLWAVTQQLLGVIMMAMSPLLLIGGYIDQKLTQRRTLKAERKVFEESLEGTRRRLDEAIAEERRVRNEELPGSARLVDDALRLGPLLWSERAESARFLTVSAGLGQDDARTKLTLPPRGDALEDCWEKLIELRERYRSVDGVPVPLELRESGAIGVAGVTEVALGVARSLVFQAAARHSPTEVAIAAIIGPGTRAQWEWLKWIPHTSSSHSPISGAHLADSRGAASVLLNQLEELIHARLDGEPKARGGISEGQQTEIPAPVVPAVLVVFDHAAQADRARLTRIVERGPDAGVHVVWCAPRPEQLPSACRSFIVADEAGYGSTGHVRRGTTITPVTLDLLDAAAAEQLARHLAPVIDAGVPDADDSDLPISVALPAVAGLDLLDDPGSVVERWRQNNSITPRDGSPPAPRKKEGNLRAVFGRTGDAAFSLDLRSDGPHALVGGTTGSGKSEFLQSWVLGMAAAHSPDRLTFLFVDYKGGAAFADCVDLPHTVGLVTDLSPHLVRRALTSLRAELKHREHLLNHFGAKDLVTLEKRGEPACPPSLIIVVDEFAALVQEVPEFVDGVVDVAQRGRSLGLHLVLATQRPAGVIRDNLRANTNLRIALRMADAEDSDDILGDKMAAFFDPSIPGRGAAKTGPGRITTFQTGYAGGHTTDEIPPPHIEIAELDFGGHAEWEVPQTEVAAPVAPGPTDISRIVTTISAAAVVAGVPAPRRPWLDELAPAYRLEKLPNPRTDQKLLLGVLDAPDAQAQPTAFYEPDSDGNLAIFGTGGSGKSTALRTIAVAAAASARHGGPTHVYGLDFGSRGLSMLEGLAHVGAIIPGDDEERVVRLLRMLRDIVDERALRYAKVNAGSIGEYRSLASAPDEARILLLVDGIGTFKEQYEFGPVNLSAWFTAFAQVAADGRAVGVHIVMAADRPNALPNSVASTVQRRIVLRMANEEEYLMLGVDRDVLDASSPAGRGILDRNEVQLAVLGGSSNVALQARAMARLKTSQETAGGIRPAPVLRLGDNIALADLPAGSSQAPVIGVDDVTLRAATLSAQGPLLLAGPPASGRTTALATFAAALARVDPALARVHIAPRKSVLSARGWTYGAQSASEAAQLAQELTPRIESGERMALFLEAVPDFTGTEAEYALDQLIKAAVREDLLVVGEGEASTWSQAYTLGQPFKAGRRGLLLAPGEMDGDMLLGTPLGRIRRADFPPGRGFLIAGGRAAKVQVAHE